MDKEYQAYYDAKRRCENIDHPRYHDWGGRGIEFRFNSFEAFYNVLGPCPEGHSLDRFDNDRHYEIYNVRWASRSQQQHNKRVSRNNKYGITGVREVKAKGLVTPTWQAFTMVNNKFTQLYAGPDYFIACCARKSFDNQYE